MSESVDSVHPYIPNSAPDVRREMLDIIGVREVEELYSAIPDDLRLHRPLDLPEPMIAEEQLKSHVLDTLSDDSSTQDYVSFLGGGCSKHFIPVICDEINSRREFASAYAGDAYSDHGKHQAWFEYQSLMGELLDCDFVSFPMYDWMAALSSSLMMALRLTSRTQVLVPRCMNPEKLSHLRNMLSASNAEILIYDFSQASGVADIDHVTQLLTEECAALYFENPVYFGSIETAADKLVELAHDVGSMAIAGVDPISLGIISPPSNYGADLVVGDTQSLGLHMTMGGATCGFIAGKHDQRIIAEYPTLLETITQTVDGQGHGFGWATLDRTSFEKRELSDDYTGTTSGLWAITTAVYLSLLGPKGMRELGIGIMQRSEYTSQMLGSLRGINSPRFPTPVFKEFVVDFHNTGKTVEEIHNQLLEYGIIGGIDLSNSFPELGESALYCVTEMNSLADLSKLEGALEEVLG